MNFIKIIISGLIMIYIITPLTGQEQKINYEDPEIIGRLKYSPINETSGMGMSYKTDNAIWVHNDSGDGPNIYLVDTEGNLLNRGLVQGVSAADWEDLSTFELNGKSYIIIGEFGDNGRSRSGYKLYIIEEPAYDPNQISGHSYPILRTINYQYDNGKQNCESVGVDVTTGKIILFSKSHDNEIRYVYELPLSVEPGTVNLTANKIASLRSDDATAMDISKDGHRAIVLTYKDFAYEFIREENETWEQAFNKGEYFDEPNGYKLPYLTIDMPLGRAGEESICYGKNSKDLYTMREGVGAEVYFLKGFYEENPNSPNKAEFSAMTEIPKIMGKGENATVSITMKNIGTSTWTKDELFKLGSVDDNGDLGLIRVDLSDVDAIAPSQEKTFTFEITGSNTPGAYNFHWRMVKDNLEWFGERTTKQKVVILSFNEYLDDCDTKTDWNPGSLLLNTMDTVQGTAALEFTGSTEQEYYKVFSQPYNAQGTPSETVLQFWYYVEDPSMFDSANQVEISSSGGSDVNEYSWSLSNLKSGWNFIQLPVSSASRTGSPNLNAINWFRLYRFKNGTTTTRVDAIQLIGENALSIDDFNNRKSFNIYPNPVDAKFFVNFTLLGSSTVSMTLMNSMGQIVSQPIHRQYMNHGNHKLEIPVATLNSGIYFANIKIDGTVLTKKVMIE
jgi:hypothetical protein